MYVCALYVCMCGLCFWMHFFSMQGLGGLYQCDYPATYDSEYNETSITFKHSSLHHPSFK